MRSNFRIITAIFVCSVFVLRILFANIGFFNTLKEENSRRVAKSTTSSVLKKRKDIEHIKNTVNNSFLCTEYFEEIEDEGIEFSQIADSNSHLKLFARINFDNGIPKYHPYAKYLFGESDRLHLRFNVFRI